MEMETYTRKNGKKELERHRKRVLRAALGASQRQECGRLLPTLYPKASDCS